jgi:glutaredoxin
VGGDGGAEHPHADRRVRHRRAARRGGDHHARDLPVTPPVVLYTAHGCHLCATARATLESEGVAYDEVDITGNAELERTYREWIPVLEIDGRRAFVYRIPVVALRRRIAAAG